MKISRGILKISQSNLSLLVSVNDLSKEKNHESRKTLNDSQCKQTGKKITLKLFSNKSSLYISHLS